MPFCKLTKSGDVTLSIKAIPNAPKTAWDSLYGDDAVKVRVHAPPVDGAANAEIIKFLAAFFDLKRSGISITSGEKARDKVFMLSGISIDDVRTKILHHLSFT